MTVYDTPCQHFVVNGAIDAASLWDPWDACHSHCGDHGDQVYLVPSNFCNWFPFSLGNVGNLRCFPRPPC